MSYEKVERMFEEHQGAWSEAIFNEDAWYKYLQPLVEDGSAAYLSMLQGSKEEQRKWWLYNRFRYIDSKYNAGDALSDVITVRGYAEFSMATKLQSLKLGDASASYSNGNLTELYLGNNVLLRSLDVRNIGFDWEAESADEVKRLLNILDTMRGLDEGGNNVSQAQVSGIIHLDSITGAEYASFLER